MKETQRFNRADQLNCNINDLIWSDKAYNYDTKELGAWVRK